MSALKLAAPLFAFLAASLSCSAPDPTQPPPSPLAGSRPNIVLVLADDLSFRDLSIWGQQEFETPNLDRLARGGLRFTQAYAGAPECAPSRGTLLSGLHTGHGPIRTNASARGQDHLADADVTIAEVLKSAGYATGFTGKWGVGLPATPGAPEKQGFDYAFGFYDQRRAHTYFPNYLYENGKRISYPANAGFDLERLYGLNVPNPDPEKLNRYDESGKLIMQDVADPAQAVFSEDPIEDNALQFIRGHKDQPFFLYFATQLPHGPPIIDHLRTLTGRDDYPGIMTKQWAAMVVRLDAFVGELEAELKTQGVWENTIILFASDNGYAMCGYLGRGNANANWPDDPFLHNKGPFRGGKFSALEGGTRVPFFAHWEDKIEPGVSNTPVWLVDLFPTFAELAGATYEHSVDGDSLLPLFERRPSGFPAERPLYWEKHREQAVRLGPWKAFRPSPDDPLELYLIEEDIHGDRNLADRYPEVVARIEQIMRDERTDHEWYWNPHETAEDYAAKRQRSKELGTLQVGVAGNSSSSHPMDP